MKTKCTTFNLLLQKEKEKEMREIRKTLATERYFASSVLGTAH
jgi:hypothetical protein